MALNGPLPGIAIELVSELIVLPAALGTWSAGKNKMVTTASTAWCPVPMVTTGIGHQAVLVYANGSSSLAATLESPLRTSYSAHENPYSKMMMCGTLPLSTATVQTLLPPFFGRMKITVYSL